jgi:hypothetical protein
MKTAKILLISLAACTIVTVLSGCAMKRAAAEEITIEGIYVKTLDHPFSGPAVMARGGYYFMSGERAKDLTNLKDKTKVRVSGRLYTRKKNIPEAGTFREITEQVIEVSKFTVISQ